MDMSMATGDVLSAKQDGTLVAYDPVDEGTLPTVIGEAYALGRPLGYVMAMMRNYRFEELDTDPEVLAFIESVEPPMGDLRPRPRIPRLSDLLQMGGEAGAAGVGAAPRPDELRDRLPEPDWVMEQVRQKSGEAEGQVVRILSAAHDVVDDLVTDDVLVVAFPLIVGRPGCPVWERVRYLVKGDWDASLDVFDGSVEDVARAASLPVEIARRYPTAGLGTIILETAEQLGIESEGDGLRRVFGVLQAWVDTYELPAGGLRPYVVRPAGLERTFEDWLVGNLHVLADHGFALRPADSERDGVAGRQVAVHGRRSIADLVCVSTIDTPEMREGDLLVVENKTTSVDARAVDQLARYVDLLASSTDRAVHGLLIADGLTVDAGRALSEREFSYLSLAAIGYRQYVRTAGLEQVADPDGTAVPYPSALSVMLHEDRAPGEEETRGT
jgi:hypothetical protein